MSKKTINILLGIFILLILISTFPWWKDYFGLGKKSAPLDLNFSIFKENNVDKFTIKKGADEKQFTKGTNAWLVNDVPASSSAVTNFFVDLENAKTGELVSKNAENHTKFGVTESDGYLLTLVQSNKTSDFLIGNSGSDFNSFYARNKDSVNVYLITGSLKDKISLDLSAWQATSSANPSSSLK
jgi:hypothetical protein